MQQKSDKNIMVKNDKDVVYFLEGVGPGLFGQKFSSGDYRFEEA